MEGMDLWNMFSTDFVEGESDSINSKLPATNNADQQYENDQLKIDLSNIEQNKENTTTDEQMMEFSTTPNNMQTEPDDDAIFDFELEPIASVSVESRSLQHQGYSHSNRFGANRDYVRPTASQINATDENGVPINYELGVVYICPSCGAEYSAQDKWKTHMNTVHQYNTRRGLNFVRIDKLYHQCLECKKNIAMHSMENLLKHKFTHLPFRCTKCAICGRQYKYRQDLMVHLRMLHRDDVIVLMREDSGKQRHLMYMKHHHQQERDLAQSQAKAKAQGSTHGRSSSGHNGPSGNNPVSRLSITNIKEHAFDLYADDESIEVRNEVLDADNDDAELIPSSALGASTIFEDEISRSSSQASGKRQDKDKDDKYRDRLCGSGETSEHTGTESKEEICEEYIQYICPECGTEFETRSQWGQHIEFAHDFLSRKTLNFRLLENKKLMRCVECQKVVESKSIRRLQLHKFTHCPHSLWVRCRLCYKGFRDRTSIQNHLLIKHNLASIINDDGSEDAYVNDVEPDYTPFDDDDDDDLSNDPADFKEVKNADGIREDVHEKHIDYLCPKCGMEFFEKKDWRTHVISVHQMNDLAKLNFKVINDRQLQCNECDKVITNAYGIQNAQQHRITHMPFKAFARCRICHKSYTDRKGLVKHLGARHLVGYGYGSYMTNEDPKSSRKSASMATGAAKADAGNLSRKQIVTVANETFEIVYLEDDTANSSNNTVDKALPPKDTSSGYATNNPSNSSNTSASSIRGDTSRFKCVDCGSLFRTSTSLRAHISKEHEFMDHQDDIDENKTSPKVNAFEDESTNVSSALSMEQHFIYMCPACGHEYKTQFDWRRHINDVHNFDKRQYLNMRQVDKFRYQCGQCKDIVCNPKLKGLQDHHFRHLPYRLYLKCLVCGICYNHKPNMMSHLRARHSITEGGANNDSEHAAASTSSQHKAQQSKKLSTMETRSTNKFLPTSAVGSVRPAGLNTVEDNISYHNAVDLDFITYFCPKCNKNFKTHAFWRKHIVDKHNFNSRDGLNFRQVDNHHFLCLECYKRVTVTHTKGAIGQLQSHKFRHLPYRSFKCLTCDSGFVRKQMFFKHLNRETMRCDNKRVANKDTELDTSSNTLSTSATDPDGSLIIDEGDGDGGGGNDDDDVQEVETDTALQNDKSDSEEPDDDPRERSGANGKSKNHVDPAIYKLLCPQCGKNFVSKSGWREHININHGLGKRELLNLNKIGESLYQCRECNRKICSTKIRILQSHKFKHLPYGAYLCCQLCDNGNFHTMKELHQHLERKHKNALVQPTAGNYTDTSETNNGRPFMLPIPPHLLDDEDVDFNEQYLLG